MLSSIMKEFKEIYVNNVNTLIFQGITLKVGLKLPSQVRKTDFF